MSDILSQMFSLPVQIIVALTIIILIMLYLLSIVWVNRDAKQRDTPVVMWTIVAIIPVAGLVAYCLLRPPLARLDADEQDMELDLLQRQLDLYGNCPHCGYSIERDFVICPKCHQQVHNVCSRCGRTLELEWTACPYCTAPVERVGARRGSGGHKSETPHVGAAHRHEGEPVAEARGELHGGGVQHKAPSRSSAGHAGAQPDPFAPRSAPPQRPSRR